MHTKTTPKTLHQLILEQALRQAGSDTKAQAQVILLYHEAFLLVLQSQEWCETCTPAIDKQAITEQVQRLLTQLAIYKAHRQTTTKTQWEIWFRSATQFPALDHLCSSCRQHLQQNILQQFRLLSQKKGE